MHLSKDQLDQVRELAKVFFSPKDIAIFLQVDPGEFSESCRDEQDPIYKAYYGGRLESEFEVRKSVLQLAISGSSPAQTMMLELLKNSTMKLSDR